MRIRLLLSAAGVLAAGAAVPASGAPPSPDPVAVVRETLRAIDDVVGPVSPVGPTGGRLLVPYQINITRTSAGTTVTTDFPSSQWNCQRPLSDFAEPFTVTCTALVDQWRCVSMPVSATAITSAVKATVTCTSSIDTGWVFAPNTGANTASLGDAPKVVCSALGGTFAEYQVICGPDPILP